MTDDLLEKATRAYRAETAPPADADPKMETFERVLARRGAPPKRSAARLVVVPLIAATLVLGAWAGATGRIAALLGRAPAPAVGSSSEGGPKGAAATAAGEPRGGDRNDAPPEESTPSAEAPSAAIEASATPPALPPRLPAKEPRALAPPPSRPSASPSPSAPSATPALSEDELYRAAHRAHFVDKDYAAALDAWDRYLAASRSGRFVVEARYNRALCLVRLGRRAAAREALLPFAEGDYGTYRAAEAKALLDSLTP